MGVQLAGGCLAVLGGQVVWGSSSHYTCNFRLPSGRKVTYGV